MTAFLSFLSDINSALNSFVWGYPMIILLLGTGIFLCIKMKFFHFRHFGYILKNTIGTVFLKKQVKSSDDNNITQFQALTTALAATIGTGNIVGVTTAIILGGPGAVFWMWLSASFGMVTMFTENILGIRFRRKNKDGTWQGGTMYYLENAFKNSKLFGGVGKALAVVFALFCMFSSLGSGNMVQSNSIACAASSETGLSPIIIGIITAVIAGVVIVGGIRRIGSFAEKLVPIMALFYIFGALAVIIFNYKRIGDSFFSIITGAFGYDAALGGISGTVMKLAVSLGFQRGIISNEAGMGSAAMIHSSADVKEPVQQGMWGIFQVFVDTIVICTLTAFTVLTSGVCDNVDIGVNICKTPVNAVILIKNAFSTVLGDFAGDFLSIAIVMFAFTTVIGWCCFGEKAAVYLFGTKAIKPYRIAYIIFIVLGSCLSLETAWSVASTLNGLMALPNLIGLLALSKTAVSLKEKYELDSFKLKK